MRERQPIVRSGRAAVRREPTPAGTPATVAELRGLADAELVENGPVVGAPSEYPLHADDDRWRSELKARGLHSDLVPCEAGAVIQPEVLRDAVGETPSRAPVRELGEGALPTLSAANIGRARELRRAFAAAADGAEVGEKLLEDLVAMEAGVALSLLDAEAMAVALLHRALPTDPVLALKVAQVAREIEGMASAVRRRMQGGLSAAANLRAQRRLLDLQRGSNGK